MSGDFEHESLKRRKPMPRTETPLIGIPNEIDEAREIPHADRQRMLTELEAKRDTEGLQQSEFKLYRSIRGSLSGRDD